MSGRPHCHLCSLNHPLQFCQTFRNLSPGLRQQTALAKGYCLNCLCHGHIKDRCPSQNRCKIVVNGKACSAKHHSLFHPDLPESGDSTKPPPSIDTSLVPKVMKLQLEETPRHVKVVSSSPNIAKELVDKSTQTPTRPPKVLVSQATQTPKDPQPSVNKVRPTAKENRLAARAKELVAQQPPRSTHLALDAPTWPLLPAIVRVHLNYKGAKMFTTFILDVHAKSSYILEEVAKELPEFTPITNQQGKMCGRFIMEPWFGHTELDSFMMDLLLCERLGFTAPASLKDDSLRQHFAHYDPLAHPLFHSYREIDGVLGKEVADRILKPQVFQSEPFLPLVQASTFGWIVSGPWKGCLCHPSGGAC